MRFPLVTAFAASIAASFAADAQTPQGSAAGRTTVARFESPAGARDYRLYVPASVQGRSGVPLVVMLHGCLQDAADIARGTRLDEHAERAAVIVAYPEQPASGNPRKCWNWFDAAHQGRDAGEPAIIAGIAREVMAQHPVDAARVYVGGISAGGAMAAIVGAAYPELFAAVGVHSGIAVGAAKSVADALGAMARGPATTPTRIAGVPPLWALQGGKDASVNAANLLALVAQFGGTASVSATGATNGYAWTRAIARDPAGAVRVESWLVAELGHAWSGGAKEGTFTDERGPDATAEMLRFFLAQRSAGRK